MFGSGILPSGLFLILLFFVPESPRWLVGKESSGARRSRSSPASAVRNMPTTEVAEIRAAIAQETGSIRQLFQPGMRLVLVIGVTLAVLQQITGINVFLYFAPEIFKKLGSETNVALLQQAIVGAVNLLFTIIAIWTVDRLGRKPLMLVGSAGDGRLAGGDGIGGLLAANRAMGARFHPRLYRLFRPVRRDRWSG